MGHLSTHVLDTVNGRPGAGIAVTLDRLGTDGSRERLAEATTNSDGRTDAPLLSGRLVTGTYELTFAIGAYFRGLGTALPEPAFLDRLVAQPDHGSLPQPAPPLSGHLVRTLSVELA